MLGIATVVGIRFIRKYQSTQQVVLGHGLYGQHCAVCHGANLEGQANWQTKKPDGHLPAPPHDDSGHTWHHSDDEIFKITKFGMSAVVPNYENDMVGFGAKLSDDEIRAIISFIKSKWSKPSRNYQKQRNLRE